MSKALSALVIIVAVFSIALAQGTLQDSKQPESSGLAPKAPNGVGRADVRVFDENGNPIKNADVKLESTRSDGFFCESWGPTNELGRIVLPPIHMGSLKFKVKARGYRTQEVQVPANQLGEPVRVTLVKKK